MKIRDNRVWDKSIVLKEYMIKIRRMIHQHPELGLNEYETTKLVKKELFDGNEESNEVSLESLREAMISYLDSNMMEE